MGQGNGEARTKSGLIVSSQLLGVDYANEVSREALRAAQQQAAQENKPIGIRDWFKDEKQLVTRGELHQVLDLLEKARKRNRGWRTWLRGKFDVLGLLKPKPRA